MFLTCGLVLGLEHIFRFVFPVQHFVTSCFSTSRSEVPNPSLTPKLEDCHLSLPTTAYWIYSQLPSVSAGRLLHQQPD